MAQEEPRTDVPASDEDAGTQAPSNGQEGESALAESSPHVVLEPMGFMPELLDQIHVRKPQVDADAADLLARRSIKKQAQVAADLLNLQCIDLTTLSGGDSEGNVDRLVERALNPVPAEVYEAFKLSGQRFTVGGVCVYQAQVEAAAARLAGRVPVATVSADFPHGQNSPIEHRCAQIREAVATGATEIDIVIRPSLALNGKWHELYDEIRLMRRACGDAHLKTILQVAHLQDYEIIAKASAVAIMAGSDFIKTSTGIGDAATPPIALVMIRQIRWFFDEIDPGRMVGFKPAGGIRTAGDARKYFVLMFEELARWEDAQNPDMRWVQPGLFRIGASSLLNDIAMQLTTNARGGGDHYADPTRIPAS